MGAKLSKRRFRGKSFFKKNIRNSTAIDNRIPTIEEDIDDEFTDDESTADSCLDHVYQNINDVRTTDIDSDDGAYYEQIDSGSQSNIQELMAHRVSTATLASRDSAFSDKTIDSKETTSSRRASLEQTSYHNDYADCKLRKRQNSSTSMTYLCNTETDTDNAYTDYLGLPKFSNNSKNRKQLARGRCSPKTGDSSSGWRNVCAAPTERIVFLLEAFQPLIEGCLNVMEIIPHLHFIEDTETFRERSRISPREAVALLIERIKESQEPGKWKTFLEALKTEGFEYIASLLLEETEADHTINRGILRLFTPELISRIDPEEFIDHLLEESVISDADRQEIQREKRERGDNAASLMLLERVPRRLTNWFDIFVGVLEKCGLKDLVEKIKIPEATTDSCRQASQYEPLEHTNYLTPCYDDYETTPAKRQKNHEQEEYVKTSSFIDSDTDDEIMRLTKQREVLRRQFEKKRQLYELRADVKRLEHDIVKLSEKDIEMESTFTATAHTKNSDETPSETPVHSETIHVPTSHIQPKRSHSSLSEAQQSEYIPLLTDHTDVKPPDTGSLAKIIHQTSGENNNSTNMFTPVVTEATQVPEDKENPLDNLVNGVANIAEILKEIKQEIRSSNNVRLSTGYHGVGPTLPSAHLHGRTRLQSDTTAYTNQSMDSAIFMGYIACNNMEQYV